MTVNLAKQLAKATAPYPNGNLVVLEHEGGLWTLYAHMDSLSVQEGQMVQQGQQVGVCGATGQVTGPHLHFEVKTAFKFGQVDPAPYMPK